MGPRPPVVSPHARAPHRPRRRIRLPRRQRKMARLLPRQPPRRRRCRPRLPHRREIRHRCHRLAGKIPPRVLRVRLDVWPHPRRPHAGKGRELHRHERIKKHHLPQRRRVLRRRGALRRGKGDARHRCRVSQRRQHGLHHRRPRDERGALSGELGGRGGAPFEIACRRCAESGRPTARDGQGNTHAAQHLASE